MGRYDRHRLIPGWNQQALQRSHVVICGVGALGSEVARLLAEAGVGELTLCDPDKVAGSNLSRSPLFRDRDVGRAKTEVAAAALADISPGIVVRPRTAPLISGVGLAELRDCSLVVSCLDSIAARIQLSGRCNLVNATLLDGGTGPWGGEVRLYRAGGPCFGCALGPTGRSVRDDPWGCDQAVTVEAGASAPVSSLIGSWLAVTAVRLLCGIDLPTRVLRVEAAAWDTERVELRRDPECPLHTALPTHAVSRLQLEHRATIGELTSALTTGEMALSWAPLAGVGGQSTRLGDAAPTARLVDLGVAPREILPVLGPGEYAAIRYVELSNTGDEGEGAT
ncbi:HesA/MoeB/ThiF family protein [Streptomyces sp. NPDC059866]|uniref:HesA/MoeB/ThiF family protein n=1 Tax=Streptomyces sp. NPDC059866 TaxID=3346978 RepID=UPI00365D46E4